MDKRSKKLCGRLKWCWQAKNSVASKHGKEDVWKDPTATIDDLLPVVEKVFCNHFRNGDRLELKQYQPWRVRPRIIRVRKVVIYTYTYQDGEWIGEKHNQTLDEQQAPCLTLDDMIALNKPAHRP